MRIQRRRIHGRIHYFPKADVGSQRCWSPFQHRIKKRKFSQQQCFRKQLSCMTAYFNLQEIVYQHIECNGNVYVGMLDQKAAFDVVWHDGLFVRLGRLGIVGKLLRTLISSYSDLSCVIKMNRRISEQFAME